MLGNSILGELDPNVILNMISKFNGLSFNFRKQKKENPNLNGVYDDLASYDHFSIS